jgi:hypothetical protein
MNSNLGWEVCCTSYLYDEFEVISSRSGVIHRCYHIDRTLYFTAKAQAGQAQAAADGAEATRACADADAYVAMNPVRILKMNNDRTQLQLQDLVNHTLFRSSPTSVVPVPLGGSSVDASGPDPHGSPMSISDLCLTQSLSFGTADMSKIGKLVAEGVPAEVRPRSGH